MKRPNDGDIIDLGRPLNLVGQTGFLKGAGGGRCCACSKLFATLLPDGRCAECSEFVLGVDGFPADPSSLKKAPK